MTIHGEFVGRHFTTPTQLMAMLVEGDGEPLRNRVGVNII